MLFIVYVMLFIVYVVVMQSVLWILILLLLFHCVSLMLVMFLSSSMNEWWCWQLGQGLPQWLSWYRPYCQMSVKRGGFVSSMPARRTMTSWWSKKLRSGGGSGTFLLSLCLARYCTRVFCLWLQLIVEKIISVYIWSYTRPVDSLGFWTWQIKSQQNSPNKAWSCVKMISISQIFFFLAIVLCQQRSVSLIHLKKKNIYMHLKLYLKRTIPIFLCTQSDYCILSGHVNNFST